MNELEAYNWMSEGATNAMSLGPKELCEVVQASMPTTGQGCDYINYTGPDPYFIGNIDSEEERRNDYDPEFDTAVINDHHPDKSNGPWAFYDLR